MTYYTYYPSDVYLAHHGIKGQKWGIRRFQNPDGTLTEEGLKRYGMQDLARRARKEARGLDKFEKDKEAAQKYKREVEQINLAIREAEKNAPLERLAQIRANIKYNKWKYDHPNEDKDHQKRQKGIELDNARRAVGAKKKTIGSEDNPLTPKMWEISSLNQTL